MKFINPKAWAVARKRTALDSILHYTQITYLIHGCFRCWLSKSGWFSCDNTNATATMHAHMTKLNTLITSLHVKNMHTDWINLVLSICYIVPECMEYIENKVVIYQLFFYNLIIVLKITQT